MHRRRGGRGDRHDPWRGRATVEGRRGYCRSMRCLQVWLPQRTRSPTAKTPRTAAMRTIHSSTFSTKNSLRPRFVHSFRRRGCSVRFEERSAQEQGSRFQPSARGIGGAPPQRLWPRPVGFVDRLWRRLSERGREETQSRGPAVLQRAELARLTIDVDGSVVRTGAKVAWAFRGFNPQSPEGPQL